MSAIAKLEWSALEYEERQRSQDWFWALGVVAVTASATAIIFGNYFFAALILLGGGLLWFFALKRPDIIYYELNEKGLKIRDRVYLYENIKSFWVEKKGSPAFFIKSERAFMPIISMPIEMIFADRIRNIMLAKNIPEEEMREHASDKIMESLGF